MNTRAAGRGTTTAGIAATTDAVTTVAAAGERGRQGTTRGVIYQPGSTLTKFGTFPENRTTSVSRSLTGSSTVPVHRKGGSRQRMSGPSTMSHPAMWTCPACGRPLTVALNPEGGEAGAHRPLEISRASAAAHACAPAARFPQFHNASSLSIIGYEPASCQPWQPPVSAGAGAEDDEGVISQSEYTLTKPSSCPNHRDHVKNHLPETAVQPPLRANPAAQPPLGKKREMYMRKTHIGAALLAAIIIAASCNETKSPVAPTPVPGQDPRWRCGRWRSWGYPRPDCRPEKSSSSRHRSDYPTGGPRPYSDPHGHPATPTSRWSRYGEYWSD